MAIVLAGCLLLWKRLSRWRRRFGAVGSPLVKPPTYRVLFLLVLIGALLISVLPEAAFVLPALDAVGLDIVTILVAFELRHYLASAARLVGLPSCADGYLRVASRIVSRCGDVLRMSPAHWMYASMWPVIWLYTIHGRMPPSALV
jgi:hypothetical protein